MSGIKKLEKHWEDTQRNFCKAVWIYRIIIGDKDLNYDVRELYI